MLTLTAQTVAAKKKAEVLQMQNYPSAKVSEYRMHGGEAVIKGRVIAKDNMTIEKMRGHMKVIMRDYIVRKEKITIPEINADGTFSINLHVPHPMFVLVYPMADVYACPGDTVELTIDTTKPNRKEGISIDGTGLSGEVNRLVNTIYTRYCDFPSARNVSEQGPDSLMKWKDVQVAQLDDMVCRMNAGLPELEGCSPLASDILRTYIIARHMEYICRYYMLTDMNDIDREAYWQRYFNFVAPREKYLLDNPLLMISADEFFFNYVESSLMRPLYTTSNMGELHEKLHLSPTDFTAQVCQLRMLFHEMDESYDEAAEEVASTLPVITHPELMHRAVFAYRDYVKEHELKASEDKSFTKGDSIFQSIIEPYMGNVIYVDFWAAWCAPCRAAMLEMREEVEANKDKPVTYLYITDDVEENCRKFIEANNIQGEHIFVTHSEWGYLQEKFQFSGIPFVVLLDRQGRQRENVTIQQLLEE